MSCATDSESRTVTCPSLLLFLATLLQPDYKLLLSIHSVVSPLGLSEYCPRRAGNKVPVLYFRFPNTAYRDDAYFGVENRLCTCSFQRRSSLVITGHRRDSNVIINARRAPTNDRVSSNVDQCVYAKTSACESRGKERLEWNQ